MKPPSPPTDSWTVPRAFRDLSLKPRLKAARRQGAACPELHAEKLARRSFRNFRCSTPETRLRRGQEPGGASQPDLPDSRQHKPRSAALDKLRAARANSFPKPLPKCRPE